MQPAIALGITLVAFGAGYMVRGRSPGNSRSLAATKTKAASAKVVRHTDTVRVAKSDTIIVARFVYADRSAKSVAVAGDFNRWEATSLTRMTDGSWARNVRLTPGRYEYAFLVDGKHWVTDRFARSEHDAFDIASSVVEANAPGGGASDDAPASSRLKKILPKITAERVLGTIAQARAHGLPAAALENRALKYAVRHVSSKDIEQSIAADAEAMERGSQLLTAAGRRDPSAAEIDATAQLIGEGVDSATIAQLVKASPANRQLEVPLRVGAELVALNTTPSEAMLRVAEKVNSGASDNQLEDLLDERPAVVAAQSKSKKKESAVAKSGSTTDVRQAGTPAKSHTTTKAHKTPK